MHTISMSDREKALENKFAHDEELKFKALARRNRLVGLWAAGLLAKPDPDGYAREVLAADFLEAGHEDVFHKLRADFDASGVTVSDEEIRSRMIEALGEAMLQVEQE